MHRAGQVLARLSSPASRITTSFFHIVHTCTCVCTVCTVCTHTDARVQPARSGKSIVPPTCLSPLCSHGFGTWLPTLSSQLLSWPAPMGPRGLQPGEPSRPPSDMVGPCPVHPRQPQHSVISLSCPMDVQAPSLGTEPGT